MDRICRAEEDSSYQWIQRTHYALAESLGLTPKQQGMIAVRELLDELLRLLEGISLTQEHGCIPYIGL